ncbi:hypothetical protein ROZALSC1DRAFT_28464 [Rozella allomycis CSF55]|uniref:Uncharacterized protein n=1 Tax=Rozella allomycis (strain CSF55) TaxID=988480 RepID=A0A075B2Q0_ROZAC|nr:hypothetical protein O9G_000637 [Rozella allomycis CSF55]RKP19998.1 hypothetical protein ROZALSC1DRAFT_28464 [Rozella allomycis CSF55]|eukprot:EPZ35241.1 hypothetical protein O9G_000637 [Rozella allomycis CSF55]
MADNIIEPRLNEIAMNLMYTVLIGLVMMAMLALRFSKMYGTPTYRVLQWIYVHELIYCFCQQILNGYSLLVPLSDYHVWYLLMIKFIECYSKNAHHLFTLVSAVLYMDISCATTLFPMKNIINDARKHTMVNIAIVASCLITASVALASQNQILKRTNYMFISNTDPILLEVIIYSFGWTSIFCFLVLIIKGYDYYTHRSKEDHSQKVSTTLIILRISALMCVLQNIVAVFITIIPGVAGVDQSNDPWLTILNVSSLIAVPVDLFLPLYSMYIDNRFPSAHSRSKKNISGFHSNPLVNGHAIIGSGNIMKHEQSTLKKMSSVTDAGNQKNSVIH